MTDDLAAATLLAERIDIFITDRPDPDPNPAFGSLSTFINRVLLNLNNFHKHTDDRAYLALYIFDVLSKNSDRSRSTPISSPWAVGHWELLRHVHGRHLLAIILLGLATAVSRCEDYNDEEFRKDVAGRWALTMIRSAGRSYGELGGVGLEEKMAALKRALFVGWGEALVRLGDRSKSTKHIDLSGWQQFQEANPLRPPLTNEPSGSQTASRGGAHQVAVQHQQASNHRIPQESESSLGHYASPMLHTAYDSHHSESYSSASSSSQRTNAQPGPSRLHTLTPPTTPTSPGPSDSLPSPDSDSGNPFLFIEFGSRN